MIASAPCSLVCSSSSMLLCPPASQTSPIITSVKSKRSVSCETRMVYGPLAGRDGRIASHGASVSCSPPVWAVAIVCATVTPCASVRSITTRSPAGAVPNTAIGVSRCSTIWSLNTAATCSKPLCVRSAAPASGPPPVTPLAPGALTAPTVLRRTTRDTRTAHAPSPRPRRCAGGRACRCPRANTRNV